MDERYGEMMLAESLQAPDTKHAIQTPDSCADYTVPSLMQSLQIWTTDSSNKTFYSPKLSNKCYWMLRRQEASSLDGITSSLVNKDALKIQLDVLPTILGLYNAEQKTNITEFHGQQLQRFSTQCHQQRNSARRLTRLSSYILLCHFSGGNYLNNIMFANIEEQYLDMVNIRKVARKFSQANERRVKY